MLRQDRERKTHTPSLPPLVFRKPAHASPLFSIVSEQLQTSCLSLQPCPVLHLWRSPSLSIAVRSQMAGLSGFATLAPKTKNLVVAGGLTAFVFGVYFYTMRAVGGTDELQMAIDKFEEKSKK
ncbi:hypothetical protein L6164_023480 [Bauhinia variegata]|uniref:Uncharacterized protein n=1 Tax=Bauhinia variegata TaxID=167791 RepID=A0ACB9MIC4_BAUVA|nr:hypothetical protein L6164_023480 [Bauhinia variegata]